MKILQEITVPQESVNDTYLTVIAITLKNGSAVKKDEIVIELETSKASIELHAETDGFVSYLCKEGDEVALNTPIVQITDVPVAVVDADTSAKTTSVKSGPKSGDIKTPAVKQIFDPVFSKRAHALIKQHQLEESTFKHLDFVTQDDVLDVINPGRKKLTVKPEQKKEEPAKRDKLPEKITLKKLTASKKREIEYLSAVQREGLIHTIFVELDLPAFFESINPGLSYFKDSMLPVLIYETSRLLVKYPEINSFFSDGSIAYYNEVNIGIAMNIDDGLKVVKMPQPDKMTLKEIEEKLFDLANAYLDKKLTPADLSDITFTITDLSANGAYFFNPLINKDNAAILAVSKIDKKLNRIILGITFDHRVTEGKTVTTFLNELKERVESYISLNKMSTDNLMCYKCMRRISDDPNSKGFIKVVNPKGEEKLICDLCYFNY